MNGIAKQGARPILDDSDEAFFERLFSMLPSDVAQSFNGDQLKAIASAFGTRRWRHHAVDLRWLIPLLGRSYYLILLAGTERRSRQRRLRDRLLHPIISIGNGIFATVFFAGILFSVLVFLYIFKSFLGIDLFSDFSLGVMPIIEQQLEMLFD